jgi:hypothetical protein
MGIRSGWTFVFWLGDPRLSRKHGRLEAHANVFQLPSHVSACLAVVGLRVLSNVLVNKLQSLLLCVHHRMAPVRMWKGSRVDRTTGHSLGTVCLRK